MNELNMLEPDVKRFCKILQTIMPDGYRITYSIGKKYFKIIHSDEGPGKSVWGFIDIDGNILMPAGWSRPAKHPRGNIKDPEILSKVVWTGPRRLK